MLRAEPGQRAGPSSSQHGGDGWSRGAELRQAVDRLREAEGAARVSTDRNRSGVRTEGAVC